MARDGSRDAPDAVLLRRLREGDEAAFAALFERHRASMEGRVRRILPRGVRRKVSISDVVQEARIVAFRRLPSFEERGEGALPAWLGEIAERKARESLRRFAGTGKRDARREITRGERPATAEVPGPDGSPVGMAMQAERRETVRRALAALPADYGEILHLTRIQGLTLAEAAVRMGRSREAAKKLNGRALASLARLLRPEAGGG